jgi:hypothetical protein
MRKVRYFVLGSKSLGMCQLSEPFRPFGYRESWFGVMNTGGKLCNFRVFAFIYNEVRSDITYVGSIAIRKYSKSESPKVEIEDHLC